MQFQISRPVHELGELLRWRGVNNTYDGMETVWTIEAMGSAPERYDWPAWVNSAARDEKNADRSPVEFVQSSDGVPVAKWTRNHFKPSPVRTAAPSAASVLMRGADVRQIPAPPQER
jgi:hypothetical protein